MASSSRVDTKAEVSADLYYARHTSHPGYARFHRYEDADYIRTYVDLCLAKIPGLAVADILSTELADILHLLGEAKEYLWWRVAVGPQTDRVHRFKRHSDALEYIVLVIDDAAALPSAQLVVAKAGIQKRIRSHEEALKKGLKYLEAQREDQRVGGTLPLYSAKPVAR
ncbi:hypothetical protein Q8F55_008249 [Vanrija albida]|uniref:Uncharacterized protein n=1 Tax=Vanrija albida TaxID=181172 RepID=A0ABR3PVU4_9TREE